MTNPHDALFSLPQTPAVPWYHLLSLLWRLWQLRAVKRLSSRGFLIFIASSSLVPPHLVRVTGWFGRKRQCLVYFFLLYLLYADFHLVLCTVQTFVVLTYCIGDFTFQRQHLTQLPLIEDDKRLRSPLLKCQFPSRVLIEVKCTASLSCKHWA